MAKKITKSILYFGIKEGKLQKLPLYIIRILKIISIEI